MRWKKWTFVVFLMTFGSVGVTEALAKATPNIVLIMTDDQGYGDIGAHGNPYLKTPNIESIGAQGVTMPTFVTYPNCSATRAALLTGRYPYRVGVTAVVNVDHFMHASEVTLAEVLRDNGYRTGIFGKWHLGDSYPMRPSNQGFEEVLVHRAGGIGAPGNDIAGPPGNSYFNPILYHNDVEKTFEGYVDDIFTDAAINFIDQKSKDNEPFFVYLASNLPHWPLQVPDHRAERFREMGLHEDNALVYGMIENIDDNVGRVLKKLKDNNIEKNTIVIFMSDNGPRHRRTKNDPFPGRWVANLRGTKTSVYEAGIRVPFFVSWPGTLPENIKTETMGTALDIFPTLLEMAGIAVPPELNIDGHSLYSEWQGEPDKGLNERLFFTQLHYGSTPFQYMHFAVRGQKYKLVGPHDNPHQIYTQPTDAEIQDVIRRLQLFDLENDESERINIAAQHPEIVDTYLEAYENWFDDVTDELSKKGIQRIYLGTKEAPNAYLSRYDWGGPRGVFTRGNAGFWRVSTVAGKYQIKVTLPFIKKDGFVHLKYQDLHIKKKVAKGQTTLTFEDVKLQAGEGNLRIYVKTERLPVGPLFVKVEKR
ncbi:arylsulfatase [Agaribacter flavus]|uniref:Arylsulfatase n=1 Tax=Agaribacter flavus TaxID=1902781 RepID=A0ABV7FQ45_9ALTE